jgi:small subunit ribosomal protein S6
MQRVYEVMYIVRPDMEEVDLDRLIEDFGKNVTEGGGSIRSTEKMGRRRLAYTVKKFNDGFYVLMTIEAEGGLIAEVERRLRVSEPVIKFITVRIDEEEKRLAKIKAHRETHVKRSAIPVQQAQSPAPAASPETSSLPPIVQPEGANVDIHSSAEPVHADAAQPTVAATSEAATSEAATTEKATA